ncbi:MAG TPA: chaperone modulator CbpM [Chitinophagaceae bacterium]|mgnify:CR=1 FL=1|nr:chaperone modulator CbpM [Chitinophagaceae bacterium]
MENMIGLNEFCSSHEIEISFVRTLEDQGLVEIIIVDQALCITEDELPRLEKLVRLHHDLNINPEGMGAVEHLLERIEEMQQEITLLRNQLSFYSEENG